MEAVRCDRCGKFFCPSDYDGVPTPTVKAFGPNGDVVPINWIGRSERRWLDMCLDCKEAFVIWWKEVQNEQNPGN